MVFDPARRTHHNLRAMPQGGNLAAIGLASNQQSRCEATRPDQAINHCVDLDGQSPV